MTTIVCTAIDGGGFNVGVARNSSDYQAVPSGSITFAGGPTSTTVPIENIGDLLMEGNEEFRIRLSNPSSGTTAFGTVRILGNDGGLRFTCGLSLWLTWALSS